VPVEGRPDPAGDEATATAKAEVRGRPTWVIGLVRPGQPDDRYYFFFALDQLEASLRELARVALAAWAFTVVVAGVIGRRVARATLRPVRSVAQAAEAIASGDLDTRLPAASDDEFGELSSSFNHMADEVQALDRQLGEAARRQERFTADVAHELRTPLTGMSATAAVLDELLPEMSPEARRSMTLLVGDVRRLRDLVLDLLELSRLDAGSTDTRAEPLRVRDAVEAVVRAADLRREAGISVEVDPGIALFADPSALRRMLGNLLDNAILHGRGRVGVRAHVAGADVLVDVMDEGDGIPASDVEHVFERFFKSDTACAGEGSGLGLAIARQHARSQGGDLTVTNQTDGTTCFTLRLPSAEPARSGDSDELAGEPA
jgi:two-component system sensor histidine kinase MtrB